jgi:protein-L-isoaspartate O-methyltransferase
MDGPSARAYRDGLFEPEVTALLRQELQEGWTVLDAGANTGYYTPTAARAVGATGRVLAFEPEPSNFAYLCRNLARNGLKNVRLWTDLRNVASAGGRLHSSPMLSAAVSGPLRCLETRGIRMSNL